MSNETLSTSIDELASIAIAEAQYTLSNSSDLRMTVTRRDVAPGQISARFPIFGALTAAALTEGNAAANQVFSTTGQVLTPSYGAVASTVITDLADWAGNRQLAAEFGKQAAEAILAKVNADIFALYDGFSVAVGTTNTDISEATILSAVKKLRQKNVRGDIFLGMTPEVAEDLMTLYSANTNNTSDRIRDAIYNGEMPMIYGVRPIIVTSGISETGDVKCGIYSKEAIGYAVAWEVKVETVRKPSSVGFEITASSAYAVGEINDECGIEVLVDGADA